MLASAIDLEYHPQRWRSARIIVLRKPGKPDYSLPGAYHPFSLLNTLGKLLEAVMAQRLSSLRSIMGFYRMLSLVDARDVQPNKLDFLQI